MIMDSCAYSQSLQHITHRVIANMALHQARSRSRPYRIDSICQTRAMIICHDVDHKCCPLPASCVRIESTHTARAFSFLMEIQYPTTADNPTLARLMSTYCCFTNCHRTSNVDILGLGELQQSKNLLQQCKDRGVNNRIPLSGWLLCLLLQVRWFIWFFA